MLMSTAKRCFSSPVVPVVRAGRLGLRVVRVTCGRYVCMRITGLGVGG